MALRNSFKRIKLVDIRYFHSKSSSLYFFSPIILIPEKNPVSKYLPLSITTFTFSRSISANLKFYSK